MLMVTSAPPSGFTTPRDCTKFVESMTRYSKSWATCGFIPTSVSFKSIYPLAPPVLEESEPKAQDCAHPPAPFQNAPLNAAVHPDGEQPRTGSAVADSVAAVDPREGLGPLVENHSQTPTAATMPPPMSSVSVTVTRRCTSSCAALSG